MTDAAELTLSRVVHYPLPGLNAPAAIRFSPDGRLVTYLWSEGNTLVRQLWAYDLDAATTRLFARAPGQGDTDRTVTPEEALRRERLRMRGFGITSYEWAEEEPVVLVPMLGQLFVGGKDGDLRRVDTGGEAIDPHLDPRGTAVAFIRDGELWAQSLRENARPRRLTFDASAPNPSGERLVTNGLAEFVAQEEMGRASGFWWSKDGTRLAFVQVDNTDVRPLTIAHDGADERTAEVHRYPFAGHANAKVRLGTIRADGADLRWLPVPVSEDCYLARVDWTPDGALLVQVQTRDQRRLDLLCLSPDSGRVETVLSERAETWINLSDDLRLLQSANGAASDYQILWSSERSGFRHLYLYTRDGQPLRQLTHGAWPVDRVLGFHADWVYFLAGMETPLERQVYRVSALTGGLEPLTTDPGMHNAVLSPSGDCFADLWDACDRPPRLGVLAADGSRPRTIFEGDAREARSLKLIAPRFIGLAAEDGTPLQAALYLPAIANTERAALIVSVYGGPHVQQVVNSWAMTVDLRAQYLAQQGYAVLKLDNRGSARRGHAFEAAILGNLGDLEVRDQVAGVRAVAGEAAIDASRVGVYGWSYGGYMALMCLLRAPEVFNVAVAGAPVTDWKDYDTHYTERYMRTPDDNSEGYQRSSALHHAAQLQGQLLIVHGMIDENVHFRHSVRLVDALVKNGKAFRLLPFPNERHMPRDEADRIYMEEQVIEHFRRHL